ncbi:hypothetical protein OIU78_023239 [Salix suchowensis]|nr:hypothetical protein OIU78_023239 [Salix suchowensis]
MRATMLFVLSAGRMCPPAMPGHCRWLLLKVNCGLSYIPCQRVVTSFIELGVIPGKSAQDCFDKVNSDLMALPQTLPRSRAKRVNSSPLECFSTSVSKLLNASGPKSKRLSYIASPPVLKQVKNKALHEKYIDHLHCREAKRKAAYARAEKSVAGKENRGEIKVKKIDVVRAAKNALVSDVRDAIYQLQDVQTNASNSSDFHDDVVGSDDDGGDSVL